MKVFLTAVFFAALISGSEHLQFGPLCSSNPTNQIRGSDSWGGGGYGARRTGGTHKGVDIECNDGSTVSAPFDLTIKRQSVPYTDPSKAAINNGIMFISKDSSGLCFKLWYVRPVKFSGELRKGDKIGTMLPMQSVYRGITSHIHVERCDKSNPSQYF